MRWPFAGRFPSGTSVLSVIQPVQAFAGRMKPPVNVAPGARATTSPGRAELSAACRSPPAATRIVRPVGAGTLALGIARGSSGGVDVPPLPAVVTETDAAPVVPVTFAVMLAVPALTAVTIPDDDTVATAVLELDQAGVPATVFPLPSFLTACACVV